jgi:arylsulfatase A-like enzyme
VAPTLLDRLGLPIPATWRGRSLLRPADERMTLHQTRRGRQTCRAVVGDRGDALFKYIRCGSEPHGASEVLYELTSDPSEQTDLLSGVDPAWLRRFRVELDSRFALQTNRCATFDCVD